ncbi:MAG: aminomethyl-transferring glycine dehydrogenase subunit GcvPA [Candidatus Kapabacteria bacterium]|nr:aminomethyl-transferring glycine dehydrogenase subunit GcvPA [Candidatus Kapabacteria bacterium]
MTFVPNTDSERAEMLKTIGVEKFDDLIANIPSKFKITEPLNLESRLSELEAFKLMDKYASRNISAVSHICYIGGGAYDHYVPSIVGSVLQKPEFKTAYTPYQAEVSQGTLQVMYEFQSMICEITGMDVANASLYDGGSALAEACLMSNAHNRKSKFLFAGTVHPSYIEATKTITAGREFTYESFIKSDGSADLDALAAAMTDDVSGVIVQTPNFLGNIEDVYAIEKIAHSKKALFIVVTNPIALGVLEAPGKYNADIVVGEGQSLGISLSYGGPYLGLFACKQEFVRKIPGRLSGITQDSEGTRCFVLTLQTREQQIKREKATSNICTNQGLFMLAATVYMTTMGKSGIKEVAEQSFHRAHYLAEQISQINGFNLINTLPFFNEFVVETPVDASTIISEGLPEGLIAGLDISRFMPERKGLMIAVTEKRTKEELDKLVEFLKKYQV